MTKWTTTMICLCCLTSMGGQAQYLAESPFHTIGGTQKAMAVTPVDEQQDTTSHQEVEDIEVEEPPQDTASFVMPLSVALPLRGIHVNSPFGMRTDPKRRSRRRMHNGIDLKARYEDVFSILPGVVEAASYSTNGGLLRLRQSWAVRMLLPASVQDMCAQGASGDGRPADSHQRQYGQAHYWPSSAPLLSMVQERQILRPEDFVTPGSRRIIKTQKINYPMEVIIILLILSIIANRRKKHKNKSHPRYNGKSDWEKTCDDGAKFFGW